jgi:hypothetical protein
MCNEIAFHYNPKDDSKKSIMNFVCLWFHSSVSGITTCTELILSSVLLNYGFCSYLRRGLGWHFPKVVGFELFTSLMMAFISWQLFSACQRPSS